MGEDNNEIRAIYDSLEDIPETIEDFRALFTEKGGKLEFTGMPGIKTQADIDRQQAALNKERSEHKATRAKLDVWGDMVHEDVITGLDRIPELEAAAGDKLDDAGIEEIVNKRVEGKLRSQMAPVERDLKRARAELVELAESNQALSADALRRSREDVLRPLLVKAKVHPEYHDDVLLYAERHLEKAPEGAGFFARDGLQGITPGAMPQDWLAEMVEKRPGWIPAPKGGGARGSSSGGGFTGTNPFAAESWNMTEQGRIAREKGMEFAERLAAAAGTKVGGPRPTAKG